MKEITLDTASSGGGASNKEAKGPEMSLVGVREPNRIRMTILDAMDRLMGHGAGHSVLPGIWNCVTL